MCIVFIWKLCIVIGQLVNSFHFYAHSRFSGAIFGQILLFLWIPEDLFMHMNIGSCLTPNQITNLDQ